LSVDEFSFVEEEEDEDDESGSGVEGCSFEVLVFSVDVSGVGVGDGVSTCTDVGGVCGVISTGGPMEGAALVG